MTNPEAVSLSDASNAVRQATVSPLELVESCLQEIAAKDQDLQAWVAVDSDGSRTVARRLGEEIACGRWRGPLHGIPVGIKDIIDVAGMPTRAASPLRREHMAPRDAEIVAQLRARGAIILGKTVTTQFACFDPPRTRNPWDATRTPGGSSSGSAVSVASGMCLAALGSQTGGSIIRPATYCGVAGLKPTCGAWSTQGVVPVSFHLDHVGPIAATVSDLELIWQTMSGTECDVVEPMADDPSQVPEMGLPDAFFFERASPAMRPVIDAAIAELVVSGADMQSVALPASFDQVQAMHRRIMAVELAQYHRTRFSDHPDAFAEGVASLIEEGLSIASVDYAEALKHRLGFIADMVDCFRDSCGVWMTPATPSTAPSRASTGDPSFNVPWSYCGFPAVSFPCGQSDDGLPFGIQMIGLPGQEERLIRVARWCEWKLVSREDPGPKNSSKTG